MSAESTTFDPYDSVLADLKAKRDQIDQAIAAIEAVRGGGAMPSITGGGAGPNIAIDSPGAFLGLSIHEAAKKLLAAKRQPLKNPDIVAAFKAGGLMLGSKDPVNTVGAVLTRRSIDVGDIVKVGRGVWGLKEWFPGRSFKNKAEKPDIDVKEESKAPEPKAPEAPAGNPLPRKPRTIIIPARPKKPVGGGSSES
jgi:hypothetical protein